MAMNPTQARTESAAASSTSSWLVARGRAASSPRTGATLGRAFFDLDVAQAQFPDSSPPR